MSDYTAPSVDEIQESMLENMPSKYDKEVGGFTYDLTKTYALEVREGREDIEAVSLKLDVYNLTGEELERHVYQRKGITKKTATYAIGEVTVKGNGTIKVGDLFETEAGTQFQATEEVIIVTEGIVKVAAVIAGDSGNIPADCINLIPITISGITEVNNPSKTYDGFDEETDESLLERYLLEIQKPATSGNVFHYLQWAREVTGVGAARIFPLWNGDNTVKVVIIDDNKEPASNELVALAQEYIDPKGENDITWGAGYGEAPIGAYCTVESASGLSISVIAALLLEDGYLLADILPNVETVVKDYLKEIAYVENHVSYALLSSKILDVEGIKEWTTLTINGGTENITILNTQVAILGSVTLNE
jgi:uncharacterized phage protein gp47/JayE